MPGQWSLNNRPRRDTKVESDCNFNKWEKEGVKAKSSIWSLNVALSTSFLTSLPFLPLAVLLHALHVILHLTKLYMTKTGNTLTFLQSLLFIGSLD